MKRTDLEKRERELKRKQKKMDVLARKSGSTEISTNPGAYIDALFSLFRYDNSKIFNTENDIEVLEVLENMKNNLSEKHWESVIKKAIKKTKVELKDKAFEELYQLMTG